MGIRRQEWVAVLRFLRRNLTSHQGGIRRNVSAPPSGALGGLSTGGVPRFPLDPLRVRMMRGGDGAVVTGEEFSA